MIDSVPDFGLGETIKGQNEDGVDINTALDGREYTFPVTAAVASAAGLHAGGPDAVLAAGRCGKKLGFFNTDSK